MVGAVDSVDNLMSELVYTRQITKILMKQILSDR